VNEPRPRGRAGALTLVALATIVVGQALLQGSTIKPAYARQLTLPAAPGARAAVTTTLRFDGPVPAWEAPIPGAGDAVIPTGRSAISVPILMYHYIRVPPDPGVDRLGWGLSTSPDDFRQQMNYLDVQGFHPITLSDLRAYLNGGRLLPDRPVVLTFDDGYSDLYTEAFPVLKQHHFKAVAYIVSGFVGRSGQNVMPEQVREMDAYGIEIGAHTQNHVDLAKASPVSLWSEVKGSRDALEALVGHPVLDFCYPSGKYDAGVIAAVQAAGFESATTTEPGVVHTLADRFAWSRVRVSGSESLGDFAAALQQVERGVVPAVTSPVRIPRTYPLVFLGDLSELE
jgi:peptidoglycan/xylan/chitin deacetylase (PgdA/CDA1 family)